MTEREEQAVEDENAAISPSPRPSPAATWALLTGGRFAGEGERARWIGFTGLADQSVRTLGRWSSTVVLGGGVWTPEQVFKLVLRTRGKKQHRSSA